MEGAGLRDDSLARQSIDCFGWKYQVHKIIQECLEAAEKGNKLEESFFNLSMRNTDEMTEAFIDELADVEIMLACAKEIFGHDRLAAARLKKEQKLRGIIDAARNSGQIA